MGCDKGLLDFAGFPLILHTAQLLERLVSEVTVVGIAPAIRGARTAGNR